MWIFKQKNLPSARSGPAKSPSRLLRVAADSGRCVKTIPVCSGRRSGNIICIIKERITCVWAATQQYGRRSHKDRSATHYPYKQGAETPDSMWRQGVTMVGELAAGCDESPPRAPLPHDQLGPFPLCVWLPRTQVVGADF